MFDGPINGESFRAYVEQQLVKVLKPDDIVVMDNLGSHKSPTVRQMTRKAGARLWYLPPYSPDLMSTAHGISSEVAPQNSPVGGMAISRRRDQHLGLLVAGPGVSGAGEWGSRLPAFCVGLSRGRDQHARVGDSSSPRFG